MHVAHCQTKQHATDGPVDDSFLTSGTLTNKTTCASWVWRCQLSNLWHTVKQNIMWQLVWDDGYLTCGTLSNKTSCDRWACRWQLSNLWHTVKKNIMLQLGCRWQSSNLWHTVKKNIMLQLGLSMTVIKPVAHCQTKHHVTAGPVDVSHLTCGTLSSKTSCDSWTCRWGLYDLWHTVKQKTSCDSWACRWQLYDLWHTVKQNIMWQLGLSMTVIWPVTHCQAKHHVTVGPVDYSYLSCGTLSNKTPSDSWACRWQSSNLWHTAKQNIMWQLGLSMAVI
jgi:hypothetical protein